MLHRDLSNAYNFGSSINAQTITSDTNGSSVDMRGCGPEMEVLLDVRSVTGTSPTFDVKVQESADDSTFTDISGATMTQATAATFEHKHFITRAQRYVRLVVTTGGTSPSAIVCGIIGCPKNVIN